MENLTVAWRFIEPALSRTYHIEVYIASRAKRNGAKMEIARTVFSPTFSAEFPVAVLVAEGRELDDR